jgi:hypothetical protein
LRVEAVIARRNSVLASEEGSKNARKLVEAAGRSWLMASPYGIAR